MSKTKNTFTAAQMQFPNLKLHVFIGDVIQVRQQISITPEANKLSGWSDVLNEWMMKSFRELTRDIDLMNAADEETVPMPGLLAHMTVGQDLTGQDQNLPQPTFGHIRNNLLNAICRQLDGLVVAATQCDSRWVQSINKMEADQFETFLTVCHKICVERGGKTQMRHMISGTLPNDLNEGFNPNGEHDVEIGTIDVGNMPGAEVLRTPGDGGGSVSSASPSTGFQPGRIPGTPRP